MAAPYLIEDLHGRLDRDAVLRMNNASAQETSLLTLDRFNQLIDWASVALTIPSATAFVLAFQQSDNYDGGHFLWFRFRFDRFLYIDRVVVSKQHRRHGLGRMLYAEVFKRAADMGHTRVVCEVNLMPPNPVSDRFHGTLGFAEVGRATIDNGAKIVRYLSANL